MKKNKALVKNFIVKHIAAPRFSRFIGRFNDGLFRNLIYRYKFYVWLRERFGEFEFVDSHADTEGRYLFSPKIHEERRYNLYKFLLEKESLDTEIDYLEFGVSGGLSIKWWVENNRHPSARFVGFDVFTGLPERWEEKAAGTFSTGGNIPDIKDTRSSFKVGLFQETLRPFLSEHPLDRRVVMHLDADLHSSTLFVLTTLAPKLKKDDILIFDEFNTVLHEFRAFMDFVNAYRLNYKLIGAANNYAQIALKIL